MDLESKLESLTLRHSGAGVMKTTAMESLKVASEQASLAEAHATRFTYPLFHPHTSYPKFQRFVQSANSLLTCHFTHTLSPSLPPSLPYTHSLPLPPSLTHTPSPSLPPSLPYSLEVRCREKREEIRILNEKMEQQKIEEETALYV